MKDMLREDVIAWMNGDSTAFESIFKLEYTKVYARIKVNMTGFDDSDIEDVTQDVFIKAYEKMHTLENPDAFEEWLMRIARNTAINEMEKRKKIVFFQTISDEEDITQEDLLESSYVEFQPEEQMSRKEIEDNLIDILNTIPPHMSLCLQMKEYDDMSYQEIADELGISLSSVKNNIFQCKKKIKAEMEARKLYSVAPVTFFFWMYRIYVEGMELGQETKVSVWNRIQESLHIGSDASVGSIKNSLATADSGRVTTNTVTSDLSQGEAVATSVAASTPPASTEAAATVAATKAGGLAVGKIVAAISAVAIIGVAGGVGVHYINQQKETEEIVTVEPADENLDEQSGGYEDEDIAREDTLDTQEESVAQDDAQKEEEAMASTENNDSSEVQEGQSTKIENVYFKEEQPGYFSDNEFLTPDATVFYTIDGTEKSFTVSDAISAMPLVLPQGWDHGYNVIRQVGDITGDGVDELVLHFLNPGNTLCETLGETYVYTIDQEKKEITQILFLGMEDATKYKEGYEYNIGAFVQDGWLEFNVATQKEDFSFAMAVVKLVYENGDWVVYETDGKSSYYGDVN